MKKIDYNKFSEEKQLEAAKNNRWLIRYINNPSEQVQLKKLNNQQLIGML